MPLKRRICFITGTRAEFGLMQRALRAIQSHPNLQLQLLVTGMHLSKAHGQSEKMIRKQGWKIDATVPWTTNDVAAATGAATAGIANELNRLKTDIAIIVGDRVEAFAAATAAHLSGKIVAHVHGGDRALGQVDDSLRHAITKLAHIHFPATVQSAGRIERMGEDRWRIHRVGSPGVESIRSDAADQSRLNPNQFALLVLHPADGDASLESRRAKMILAALKACRIPQTVIIYPNNDPGSIGISRYWNSLKPSANLILHRDIPRAEFLGLLRDCAFLIGNSSAGIIEAASFGTPVIDIGPRQAGRERSQNVTNIPYSKSAIADAVSRIWNRGKPRKFRGSNIYAAPATAQRMANILADAPISRVDFHRKLIAY